VARRRRVAIGLSYHPWGLVSAIGLTCLLVGAVLTRLRASRRHGHPETAVIAADAGTLLLTAATAVAFASRL